MMQFGRDWSEQGEQREWLVTNGIGGYGAGTIAGVLTRRYHGLLFAALKPPLQRTLLVTKVEETLLTEDGQYPLEGDRRIEGEETARPLQSDRFLESFHLDRQVPCWRYSWGLTQIEKRIWMAQGENTTYVQYELVRGTEPVTLAFGILVNYRNHHATTTAHGWRMEVTPVTEGLRVQSFAEAQPFFLLSPTIALEPVHQWQRGYDLSLERYRGLPFLEDHLKVATGQVTLSPRQPVALVFSTQASPSLDHSQALVNRYAHSQDLLDRVLTRIPQPPVAPPPASPEPSTPPWLPQLLLAADQFIVDRSTLNPLTQQREPGKTIIAGYPWFGDWGRDTMISLPGLTLVTQRPEIARPILLTFGRYLSEGMLPNVFPEANETPQYNTVDATLWYFNAIAYYCAATQDWSLLEELFPALETIVAWHQRGTRYQIHWDAEDGLIYAGEPGVQLTWMDAKVGDWVVTPRQGKPVEINALWYNALILMQGFAQQLGRSPQPYGELAALARAGFQQFWIPDLGYCCDVISSPHAPQGRDTALRPNQLLAVTLPAPHLAHTAPRLLSPHQAKAIVQTCGRWLLTSYGLRSLSPQDPQYQGHYGGSLVERDGAYHQGTVWGWWIGIYAEAHFQVYGDRAQALSLLAPMADQLRSQCVGTLAEIFDGDPPFAPRGAFAQAWTVAEVLRSWAVISGN